MKRKSYLLVIGFLFFMLSGTAAASSFGEQGYLPSWADDETLIASWQNIGNNPTNKSFSESFDFTGPVDSVDVFFEFIYYRYQPLPGTRYSSGIDWELGSYSDYQQLTPGNTTIVDDSGTWEVVAFSVNLNPGNPGTITTSADVSYHFDKYFDYPNGGWVGSDNQFIGEYYVYAQPNTSAVPEPATLFLVGLGLVGLAGAKRKFNK